MNILKNDIRREALKKAEESLAKEGRLYIWGCSQTAKMISSYIEKNSSAEISGYIIDDKYYSKDTFMNKSVRRASEAVSHLGKGDVIVCGFTDETQQERIRGLVPEGVTVLYFYLPYSFTSCGEMLSYEQYEENKARFEKTYELLCDDISRKTMEAFINGTVTGDVSSLDSQKAEGQYFNELTKGRCSGIFVDLGAYIGDTAVSAFDFFKDDIKGIISFEPDEINIEKYKENTAAAKLPEDKITIVPKGSWSCEDKLYFSSSDSSSSISDSGDIVIETDSVDHAASSVTEPVAFIKLDVEGSEKQSIIGSAETIGKYKPLIAVCVYHKPLDLCEIPETVAEITDLSDYDCYLRYYGPDLRELVMYMIPKTE